MPRTAHALASGLRHSRALVPLEPVWMALEPIWNKLMAVASGRRGHLARINDETMRLTYEYGARFEKTGYEPRIYDLVSRLATDGAVVFDVGAHVGVLTIAAAKRVGSTGRVFAFEPAPETAAVLRRHVAMNGVDDRVTVVEAVASDNEGSASFHVYGQSMAASLARGALDLSPEQFEHEPEKIEVASTTLDRVAREAGCVPTLVKIDVEGAELQVLRGMPSLLNNGSVTVVCEIHPKQLAALGGTVDDLEAFVTAHGRSIEMLDDPNAMGIHHVLLRPR